MRCGHTRGVSGREHAILWGSLRGQCDYFVAVCGAEAGIATTEGVLECTVQHRCPHVEEGLHRRPVPAHLLLLVHAFGDDLVDRTLHERGRDWFAIPAPGGVMDQRSLVPPEVSQQLADVVLGPSQSWGSGGLHDVRARPLTFGPD